MKKYLVLFAGIFMFSACAAAPVQRVDLRGDDYYVSISSYPRHHIHHPVIIRPARPKHHKHIAPKPPRPPHPSQPPRQPHWRG